ncbi:hypothetical protein [Mycetohabitans sp. B6]|nr:hypothetical protein [Mycetohabitans sp. B6]MCG1047164.1 hypothetical protein [Mycetohabitans sp. B6]
MSISATSQDYGTASTTSPHYTEHDRRKERRVTLNTEEPVVARAARVES